MCMCRTLNDAFYEILSDWNINLSLTQAMFLLLPFLVSPQFAIFSFRLYFIPPWDLLDVFPVSLFFFNYPHPSAFPLTAGHFWTCPSLLWYQCPPFVCSLLLVFFTVKQSLLYKSGWCCWKKYIFLNILRIQIKYPVFSLATLFTRKMLLWFSKSVLFQRQMLNLNLSRMTCGPFRHLGVDKEGLKNCRLRVVFLC